MKHIRKCILHVCLTICLTGISMIFPACSEMSSSSYRQLKNEVETFANAYFNFNFSVAIDHCDARSRRWIKYIATNLTQDDIDVLQKQPEEATVVIDNVVLEETEGYVVVTVSNYMQLDNIGGDGVMKDKGVFRIPVVNENGKWTVRMEGPLRSETSGRGSDED